jgi:hypothetical protein
MGYYTETVRQVGRNRAEAERAAVAAFRAEHGGAVRVDGVESAKLVRKVPPKMEVRETLFRGGYRQQSVYRTREGDDTKAPAEKWLEEWDFVLTVRS